MRTRTLIAFTLLALTASFTGSAQTPQTQPVKPLEQIADVSDIKMFIPDAAVAAKLTAEEQKRLKLHLTNLMAHSLRLGYQDGAKASSEFFLGEFAKFTADQQQLAARQSKPSRLDKVAAALQGFSQGMAAASAIRLNCVSNSIGSYTYTKCY
jgi:hypothetical protein